MSKRTIAISVFGVIFNLLLMLAFSAQAKTNTESAPTLLIPLHQVK